MPPLDDARYWVPTSKLRDVIRALGALADARG